MRGMVRSLGGVGLALLSVVGLAVAWTATTIVQLTATALIMGGTGHPLSTPPDPLTYINPYMSNAVTGFINPASAAPTGTGGEPIDGVGDNEDRYAIITPEQFFPVAGSTTFDRSVAAGLANLSRCIRGASDCAYNTSVPGAPADVPAAEDEFVVFGYSQSAVIASLLKRDMIEDPEDYPDLEPGDVSFFLLANPMRPNGGFLSRGPTGATIPILGVTFYGATPTNSCQPDGDCYQTADLAAQYDGLGGDAPASITNLLAVTNAALGYYYFHGDLQEGDFDDAQYQGSYGDTDYYIVPARRLPLLMPFESFVPSPILTLLEAPLKAAIEAGYARDINPGVATKVGLLPFRNPVQAIVNIVKAIPVGIDDAVAEASGDATNRPLGTTPVTSPFGVGGPELPEPPAGDQNLVMSRMSDTSTLRGEITEEEVVNDEELPGNVAEEVKENVVEEDEEEPARKPAATTPGTTKRPVTPLNKLRDTMDGIRDGIRDTIRLPKVRGPISFDSQRSTKPSTTKKPDNRETTTGEPKSAPAPASEPAA
ncbi:PE-PPE domain-containing protein [Mycolicibacterium moriokaense]|nr:PE-PPE domain-containing protein [Mycolicibacterium moriokaense]MCV7041170.1 PE-PPE domain-containing protein [Mycolicibacterium moriokaense]ORB27223.1 PE-PPE domain-containing protein [Mycolicibacterium moriokaense]